ncbi:hypothetical protein [Paraburkholderia ribeironis]|uniref:hypothetical protein n=1 Tax=Paraburkholderia ribeironis TaxID=1247936 RepID=UPI0011779F37|nr:hypothetical protein [Paraburkholderia ribeironis]
MDNALSFQKKRNETTGLGGVPAVRASCFAARLPVDALDGARWRERADANAGEACSRGILLISTTAAIHDAQDWPSGQDAAGAMKADAARRAVDAAAARLPSLFLVVALFMVLYRVVARVCPPHPRHAVTLYLPLICCLFAAHLRRFSSSSQRSSAISSSSSIAA